MSLTTVDVAKLKANPYRRLQEYPIDRTKVDTLKESIQSTGFWGTIVARQRGQDFEIAFGHHRMVAIQELGLDQVDIIVRDLTNEQMIQMMGRENLEEWGSSAWVEMETIRAAIEAYGKGEISLPSVPTKTREDQILYVCATSRTHAYTKATVASFLGWTSKVRDSVRPNRACETAFRALELIDRGLLEERELKGLSRSQMDTLVSGQMKIHRAEMRDAEEYREQAEEEKEVAATVEAPVERAKRQERAKHFEKLAEAHEQDARSKARVFAKEAKEAFQKGEGVREVAKMARESVPPMATGSESKVHSADEFAQRIIKWAFEFRMDKNHNADLEFLRKNLKNDVSPDVSKQLHQEFDAIAAWVERVKRDCLPDELSSTPYFHEAGEKNGRRAIEGNRS